MDIIDLKILKLLSVDAEMPMKEIGDKCGINSPSAISKRIKKLKEQNVIKSIRAEVDYSKFGLNFLAVTFIKAKYKKNYTDLLSGKLLKISGIITLLEILGEIDFVIITLNKDQEAYKENMRYLMSLDEIDRTDTRVVIENFMLCDFSKIDISEEFNIKISKL
ncbi:Lrp/AsnC family transcriptional regulator [Oxyplasma meridianum]|uniref:Lrp/AsnC family transcriptional regulator n=1 Tax=Oxyplasma meridianum TaxID=3073602 RepID=A0AAX4NEX9_9ARCH